MFQKAQGLVIDQDHCHPSSYISFKKRGWGTKSINVLNLRFSHLYVVQIKYKKCINTAFATAEWTGSNRIRTTTSQNIGLQWKYLCFCVLSGECGGPSAPLSFLFLPLTSFPSKNSEIKGKRSTFIYHKNEVPKAAHKSNRN